MRVKTCVIAAAAGAVLCCGLMARGQTRDKTAEGKKAPAEVGKKPAADAAKKPADAGKSGGEAGKAAPSKPADGGATAGDADEKTVRASAETFTKLYNAHDAKALAVLFAPKAEMIDEDGQVVRGREAIEKGFSSVFQQHPKAAMQVDVESVRVLTPSLAIEEGLARSKDSPDGPEDITVYVAIHVKVDGKWLLACVRDWDAPPESLSPHDHLMELEWLVGEWIEESPAAVVHTKCQWHDNGSFLMQEFNIHIGGDIAMSGTLRIGWDAVARQFRSWVFDSKGGHAGGLWLRDGDEWIVKSQGATAAGETASSTNIYRLIDKDTIGWRSTDRVMDGERQGDIEEIIMKRRPPLPGS
jgi:uncharacterized protein (TIGR02246 family)